MDAPLFDVIFLIEASAVNGAYFHEILEYGILDYFSGKNLDNSLDNNHDILMTGSGKTSNFYGIVLYKTAQSIPNSTSTFGPFVSSHKFLRTLESLNLVNGGSESNIFVSSVFCCMIFTQIYL